MQSSFKLWRVIAFAAIAALALPGGIALSNYSGPNPQTQTLLPAWSDADHSTVESCLSPLSTCSADATASRHTGELKGVALLDSGLNGYLPSAGTSESAASASVHIVDEFDQGTTDDALYRFFVRVVDVHLDEHALPIVPSGIAYAEMEFTVAPQSCPSCRRSTSLSLFDDTPALVTIDLIVPGTFAGTVDATVGLVAGARSTTVWAGSFHSTATVRVEKVERIW